MGKVEVHYPHMMEVSAVYTACMISMLRVAGEMQMTPHEKACFAWAHTTLADFMGRLDERAIDEWRQGIIAALEEIRKEEEADGRNGASHATDARGRS